MNYYAQLLLIIFFTSLTYSFTLDRVILSSNDNPLYLEFWPYAAKAWTQLIGIKPTLALIGDETVHVDESLGDVIRFKPLPGVPTGLHAQLIRLLLPAYFPNDGCIISDIDQLPINKSYFIDQVRDISNNKFVIYNNLAYGPDAQRFAMCYVAALGKTFKEVFNIPDITCIPQIIKQWAEKKLGFDTDEFLLYNYVTSWQDYTTRCVKLNDNLGPWSNRRIQRYLWYYDKQLLKNKYYVDACLIRPYREYKKDLDTLAQLAGVH
jgi:hypothetical protein